MNSMITILYAADVPRAVAFYEAILGVQPAEASPGFAMFVSPSGAKLGLWARQGVLPAPPESAFGGEICLAVARGDVDALHARWSQRGVRIAQTPTQMDFGYTFLALDPEGHRVRVFAPQE